MANEINAIRNGIKQLLKNNASAVEKYVVYLFNDPFKETKETFIRSNDPTEIINFTDSIRPHAGWDCPEMAMTALLGALDKSSFGSFIFFFSDASAKDYTKHSLVTAVAQERLVKLFLVLTGCCSHCESEQFKAYEKLATATNGRFYNVSKTGVEKVIVLSSVDPKGIDI